jgi:hypothetical protein
MAEQQKRKPPREPDVLSDNKLALWGAVLREGARSSQLWLDKDENNPVINMDTGYKTEGKNGKEGYAVKVRTPMAPRPFRSLMRLIIKVAQSRTPVAFEVDNWNFAWNFNRELGKNERAKERSVISRFQIEKREDGVVTFGVTARGVDGVVFEFKEDEYHVTRTNGAAVDVNITSPEAAIAWAEQLLEVYSNDFRERWKEPEYAKKKRMERMAKFADRSTGSGGGGSYQQNRPAQQSNNNQQSNSGGLPAFDGGDDAFDEDIPF